MTHVAASSSVRRRAASLRGAALRALLLAAVASAVAAQQVKPPDPPVPPGAPASRPAEGGVRVETFGPSRAFGGTASRPDAAPAAPSVDFGGPPVAVDYFPSAPGARWTWRATRRAAADEPTPPAATRVAEVLLNDVPVADGACTERRVTHGAFASYDYEGPRADGWYRYKNAYLGGLRGVDPKSAPAPVLKDPLKVGASWSFVDHLTYQVMGDAPLPTEEETRFVVTSTIEALDDPVTTDAGRRLALRVRRATRGAGGDSDVVEWFERAVGLVRRVDGPPGFDPRDDAAATASLVLVSFDSPAAAPAFDARARLADALAVLPPWRDDPSPARLAPFVARPFTDRLRARLFVATSSGAAPRRALWFVAPVVALGPRLTTGDVGELDPAIPGGWNELFRKDVFRLDAGLDGTQAAEELAHALAAAHAALRGATYAEAKLPGGARSESTVAADGSVTARVAARATDASGRAEAFTVELVVREGALVAATFETTAR